MDKIIEKAVREFGEKERKTGPYKESTIKIYVSNISNLHNICCGDVPFTDLDWLKDHKKVDEYLLGEKLATRRNYINSIVVALNTQNPKNNGLLRVYEMKRDVLNDATKKSKKNGLTDKQQEVFKKVSKDKMNSFVDGIDLGKQLFNFNEYMMGMILKIHQKYPFRNELAEMDIIGVRPYYRLGEEEKKKNWCVIGRNDGKVCLKFVLNVYKTSKTYGQRVIEVSYEIVPIIMTWLKKVRGFEKVNTFSEPVPMLCWKNGNPISRNEMTHKLSDHTQKHLGAKISTTLLAKYFNPELDTKKPMTTTALFEMDKKLSARGHSLTTNLENY